MNTPAVAMPKVALWLALKPPWPFDGATAESPSPDEANIMASICAMATRTVSHFLSAFSVLRPRRGGGSAPLGQRYPASNLSRNSWAAARPESYNSTLRSFDNSNSVVPTPLVSMSIVLSKLSLSM